MTEACHFGKPPHHAILAVASVSLLLIAEYDEESKRTRFGVDRVRGAVDRKLMRQFGPIAFGRSGQINICVPTVAHGSLDQWQVVFKPRPSMSNCL